MKKKKTPEQIKAEAEEFQASQGLEDVPEEEGLEEDEWAPYGIDNLVLPQGRILKGASAIKKMVMPGRAVGGRAVGRAAEKVLEPDARDIERAAEVAKSRGGKVFDEFMRDPKAFATKLKEEAIAKAKETRKAMAERLKKTTPEFAEDFIYEQESDAAYGGGTSSTGRNKLGKIKAIRRPLK